MIEDKDLLLTSFDVDILNYVKEIGKTFHGWMKPSRVASRIRKACRGPYLQGPQVEPTLEKLAKLDLIEKRKIGTFFYGLAYRAKREDFEDDNEDD